MSHSEKEFKKKIAKIANVSVADIDWSTLIILHKAIDARDKKNILFVYNVAFDFVSKVKGASDNAGASAGVGASIASPDVIVKDYYNGNFSSDRLTTKS